MIWIIRHSVLNPHTYCSMNYCTLRRTTVKFCSKWSNFDKIQFWVSIFAISFYNLFCHNKTVWLLLIFNLYRLCIALCKVLCAFQLDVWHSSVLLKYLFVLGQPIAAVAPEFCPLLYKDFVMLSWWVSYKHQS